jgi:hypothetical protein
MAREVRRAPDGARRVIRPRWRGRNAGVLEAGHWREPAAGPPQGGRRHPWAAHLYRHDVLALWAERGRRRNARGDRIIGRCAEAARLGCAQRDEAARCWAARRERCQPFHRALPPEKPRLLEFGRFTAERRPRRGQGRAEPCDCLGCTHMSRKTRTGTCTVRRKTIAQRLRKNLPDSTAALRERMYWPIPPPGAWLRRVLLGHSRYDAVPRNGSLLTVFREVSRRYGGRTLRRRSQRHRMPCQRMDALVERWRPSPHILHPSPAQRRRVTTRGRSPGRERRTPGSVRGVLGNRHPYRDR